MCGLYRTTLGDAIEEHIGWGRQRNIQGGADRAGPCPPHRGRQGTATYSAGMHTVQDCKAACCNKNKVMSRGTG